MCVIYFSTSIFIIQIQLVTIVCIILYNKTLGKLKASVSVYVCGFFLLVNTLNGCKEEEWNILYDLQLKYENNKKGCWYISRYL